MTDEFAARQRLYDSYVSTHASFDPAQTHLALSRQVRPLLPRERSSRILDIGCGAGDLLDLLQRAGYTETRGVDVSPEQVARAAERGISGVFEGDLLAALADERGTLDAVVALDVLEHFTVHEVMQVLDAIVTALRPGVGVLVARVPNAVSPFFGRYRYGDLTHRLAFTSQSLSQAMNEAGFAKSRFVAARPIPHGPTSMLRLITWTAIAAGLKGMLAVETGEIRGHIVTQNIMVVASR